MENKQTLTKTLLSVTVLAAVIVSAVLYSRFERSQSQLAASYRNVHAELQSAAADTERSAAGERGESLFPDCAERAAYDTLLQKDSRTMTQTQLREAIRLHATCGKHFVLTKRYSLGRLEAASTQATNLAAIASGSQGKTLSENALLWKTIAAIENKKTEVLAQQVALQGSYWETELKGKTGVISAAERERIFADLNHEALQTQQEMKEYIAEIAQTKASEETLALKIK